MHIEGDLVAYITYRGDKVVSHIGDAVRHVKVGDKIRTHVPPCEGFTVIHAYQVQEVLL